MTVPGAAAVQQYVQEVLQRPEFNAAPPQPRAPGWLLRLLEWLASHRLPTLGNVSIGTLILLAAAAALLTFLAIRLVRFIHAGGFGPLRAGGAGPAQDRKNAAAIPAALRESIRLAGQALASGDARGAIQELLRAGLAHLAALGVIVLEKWKTNVAYVRECPPGLPAFGVFRDLAQAHNDIVYAHRSVNHARIEALMDDLLGQIEAG